VKIDVEEFLRDCGVKNVRRAGSEVNFSCPFPEHGAGDAHPSARMNSDSTAWICHACHRRGNAVSFLSDLEGISPIEAIERLQGSDRLPATPVAADFLDRLRGLLDPPSEAEVFADPDRFPVYAEWCRPPWTEVDLWAPEAYLLRRGFSRQFLDEVGVMWDPARRRVVLPVEQDGVLVGAKGRAVDDSVHPKYHIYAPEYRASRTLFNLDRASRRKTLSPPSMPMIVCEGELNAWALDMMDWPAVALGGSHMSSSQEEMIVRCPGVNEVILWFDEDGAGELGVVEAARRLNQWVSVEVLLTKSDPAKMLLVRSEEILLSISKATPFLNYMMMR
jgi:DNA primase